MKENFSPEKSSVKAEDTENSVVEALRKSEEKYRTLFNSIDQGLTLCEIIRNKEGKAIDLCILEVNPTYEEQTGVTKEVVIGKPLLQVFPSLNKFMEIYAAVVDNQSPVVFEHYFEDTNRWFAIKAYPVEKEKFAVLFSNITERKQVEEKLKANEIVFKSIPDAIISSDLTGKVISWNQCAEALYGFTAEEMIGQKMHDIVPTEMLNKEQENWEEIFATTGEWKGEVIQTCKDGKKIYVLAAAHIITNTLGEMVGYVSVNRDITAHKKMGIQHAYLLKLSDALRLLSDTQQIKIKAMQVLGEHLNVSRCYYAEVLEDGKHCVIDNSFSSGLGTIDGTYHLEDFGKAKVAVLQLGEVISTADVANDTSATQEERDRNLEMQIHAYINVPLVKDNLLICLLGVNQSVVRNWTAAELTIVKETAERTWAAVERARAETKLIEAKKVAENAAKSKQQFLSNMSHEIRTPLNSIVGFTNVLLKTPLALNQQEFVQAINTSSKSLNLLINDILDLAKVDAGKMIFEKQPFEIRASLKALLYTFDFKIKEKKLVLIKEYDTNIPLVLLGDSVRLNQIILNLISNAIKFTHTGKIVLNVKLLIQDQQNITIQFTLTDTGIGIPPNKIKSIFNLFEQAELTTSKSYGGTGLGLAIVKQLIESQGGTISVISKLGVGSTFTFTLPFEKTNIKAEQEIETFQLDSEIKDLRILVAEDVALNQLLIKIILNDFGFEFEIVSNGKLAVEKMQTNTYDIILMDLQMPEMNGFEATEYIRKTLKSQIPIIALTADVTTADVTKCKEFGLDDYISKPIDEKKLYDKIVELVKKKK